MIEMFYFLKNFLISVNAAISFYIMPDYNHGIFSDTDSGRINLSRKRPTSSPTGTDFYVGKGDIKDATSHLCSCSSRFPLYYPPDDWCSWFGKLAEAESKIP